MQVDGSMAWVVSSRGLLMVAGAKLQVEHAHRGKGVIVAIDDNRFRVLHDGTQLSARPGIAAATIQPRMIAPMMITHLGGLRGLRASAPVVAPGSAAIAPRVL
jgi:hypothetical protein